MRQNANDVIRQIAKREGVSEQAIIDEMQKAIDEGCASADPTVRAYWSSMPFKGKPTPQELIVYLARNAQHKHLC